jgi:hypothetical protein
MTDSGTDSLMIEDQELFFKSGWIRIGFARPVRDSAANKSKEIHALFVRTNLDS